MKLGQTLGLLASVFSLVIGFSAVSFAKSPHVVKHVVLEDETAWFLASVYYGNGAQYPKLLTSNHLSRPEEIKEGMEIQIEEPRFFKQQENFSVRYNELWEKRQKALGLQSGSPLPNAKVVIPTETIRNQDSLQKLPFTEVKSVAQPKPEAAMDGHREPAEKADKQHGESH